MPAALSGRATELAGLRDVLVHVAGSTARGIVIEGEAGIGKSRLVEAAIREAEERGFAVFGARSEELEQQRSFGTILALARRMEPEALRPSALGGLDGVPDAGFRVIDEIVDLVESRAVGGPVLLWVDDIQWADEWTARSLGIVYRRLRDLPLALMLAMRPSPRTAQLSSLVRALAPDGLHLRLDPLDDEAVAELVRERAGAEPSSELQDVLRRAGGNPFFVGELYSALDREGRLTLSDRGLQVGEAPMPRGLLVTVLLRLSALPPPEIEAVRVAAVLGGSFTVRDLALASGKAEQNLLDSLLKLRQEGILVEENSRFRFGHDLVREAVYEDLGAAVRNSMHARIGHAFAEANMDDVEVAHHLLRGADGGDTLAAKRMIEAAESPGITMQQSAALLMRALEIAPHTPDADQLKMNIATSLSSSERPADALPVLEDLLAAQPEDVHRLRIVLHLAVAAARAGDTVTERVWRTEGSRLAERLEESEDGVALLSVAHCLFYDGHVERAQHAAERAARLARSIDDQLTEEAAEATDSWLLTVLGHPRRAITHSERALGLGRGKSAEAMKRLHLSWALAGVGDPRAARRELDAARQLAEETGFVAVQLKALCDSAWLAYYAGDWERAALDAETALQLMSSYELGVDSAHPLFVLAWLAFRRDEPARARSLLNEAVSADPDDARFQGPWLGMELEMAAGRPIEARQQCRALLEHYGAHRWGVHLEGLLPDVARIAGAAGDAELARAALDESARLIQRTDTASNTLAAHRCRVTVERDADAARISVSMGEASLWPIEKAGAFEEAAAVLPDRGEEVLATAMSIYSGLGSVVDERRIGARMGVAPSRRRRVARPPMGWDALTDAERRVVDLVVEGLTNREIGERLFISHRTVGAHLGRVFDKLGVRSRLELTVQALSRFEGSSRA